MIIRSRINELIKPEFRLQVYKINLSTASIEEKSRRVKNELTKFKIPYHTLGDGTNRLAVHCANYCLKVAIDRDGGIDNLREFLYHDQTAQFTPEAYEVDYDYGTVMFCEEVRPMTLEEFKSKQDNLRKILTKLSEDFIIGDMGLVGKNFTNFGVTKDGRDVILDYAYIYSLSENLHMCDVCAAKGTSYPLVPTSDFTGLTCSNPFHKKYTIPFHEFRMRITMEEQVREIQRILKKKHVHIIDKPHTILESNDDKNYKKQNKKTMGSITDEDILSVIKV